MPQESTSPCDAYERLQAATVALGRPLIAEEVARIIETDPATAREFRAINDEIGSGAKISDVEIAARIRMPVTFVRSLILALRGDAASERPSATN